MKKSLIAHKSRYSGLNFSKKNHCPRSEAFAKTDSLKNAPNRQKEQNWDLEPPFKAIIQST